MRSDRHKKGNVTAVLLILALIWIGAGTFGMVKLRSIINRMPGQQAGTEEQIVEEDEAGADETDPDEIDEDIPEEEDADEEDEEDEEDEDEEEPEKDYVVMVVQAPDNYAAVRTGRGTQFQEVGRITNGHRVALKDLQNGWYMIAKGKYKGYYTHQSSFVPE